MTTTVKNQSILLIKQQIRDDKFLCAEPTSNKIQYQNHSTTKPLKQQGQAQNNAHSITKSIF